MDQQAERTRFVVALGNPGRRYARTRHNVGWFVSTALRKRWNAEKGRRAFGGRLLDLRPAVADGQPRRVMLFEPLTYMNRSGEAAATLVGFYKADWTDVLVVLDDMALPPGKLRARAGGSDGGHNGLKDVLAMAGTQEVPRLRIGIGPPPAGMDAIDYVLTAFGDEQKQTIDKAVDKAADAVEDWIEFDIKYVMDKYNAETEEPQGTENGTNK